MAARPPWASVKEIWRVLLGSGVIMYGVIVTARTSPGALPYVLATGLGLIGLSITVPWEKKKDDPVDEEVSS